MVFDVEVEHVLVPCELLFDEHLLLAEIGWNIRMQFVGHVLHAHRGLGACGCDGSDAARKLPQRLPHRLQFCEKKSRRLIIRFFTLSMTQCVHMIDRSPDCSVEVSHQCGAGSIAQASK